MNRPDPTTAYREPDPSKRTGDAPPRGRLRPLVRSVSPPEVAFVQSVLDERGIAFSANRIDPSADGYGGLPWTEFVVYDADFAAARRALLDEVERLPASDELLERLAEAEAVDPLADPSPTSLTTSGGMRLLAAIVVAMAIVWTLVSLARFAGLIET